MLTLRLFIIPLGIGLRPALFPSFSGFFVKEDQIWASRGNQKSLWRSDSLDSQEMRAADLHSLRQKKSL